METKETELTFLSRTSKRQSFDKRLIAHIISLIGQGVPRKSIVAEYGVRNETLSRWLRGDNSSVVSRKSYTRLEKRSVIRAIECGLSVKQAQIAFNISSPSVIRRWMKVFEEENAELSVTKPIEVAKKTSDTTEKLELKALQKALEEANLKIRALDTMIDIAEEQLKIDIRKKSGARQSSK